MGWSVEDVEYIIPEDPEMDAIDLSIPWIGKSDKPSCVYPGSSCPKDVEHPDEEVGITLDPNYDDDELFNGDANRYMQYWLAFEKLNPCRYRLHANCIGAAYAVSYLYRGWTWPILDNYVDSNNGYGDPKHWKTIVDVEKYFKWDTWPHRKKAGDIIAYVRRDTDGLFPPQHMIVITAESGMCFEKQSPGSQENQYEKWYYQLRPCGGGPDYDRMRFDQNYYYPNMD